MKIALVSSLDDSCEPFARATKAATLATTTSIVIIVITSTTTMLLESNYHGNNGFSHVLMTYTHCCTAEHSLKCI